MKVNKLFFLTVLALHILGGADALCQSDLNTLVDPFSGSFKYSIPVVTVPGPPGSGITINLHYSSDVRPEQEASWVGFGWNLDIPTINRNKKGLPDDYDNVKIRAKHIVPNRAITLIRPLGLPELFKLDVVPLSTSANLTIKDDSEAGIDVLVGARMSAAYGKFMGSWSLTERAAPSFGVAASYNATDTSMRVGAGLSLGNKPPIGLMSPSMATISIESWNMQGTFKAGSIEESVPEIGLNITTSSVSVKDKELQAYGFLWAPNATASGVKDAMLDYSTERSSGTEGLERPFSAMPFGDADQFVVSASGIQGTFRAYHRLPFEVHPAKAVVKSVFYNVHAELMVSPPKVLPSGQITSAFGFGSVLPPVNTTEFEIGPMNSTLGGSRRFLEEDLDLNEMKPFVFRYISDPADEVRVSNHDNPAIGGLTDGLSPLDFHELNRDRPVRSNTFVRPLYFGSSYSNSDWLGKVFLFGGNPKYANLTDNSLVGIEIVASDGTLYKFRETILSADEKSTTRVLRHDDDIARAAPRIYYVPSSRTGQDPVSAYKEFHEMQMTPAYADEFMVSEILSPEYVDNGAPGPSNDDYGGWTKFKYQFASTNYDMRSPYAGYWFDKGALEDGKDDKLVAMRASKQLKVIKSIETATHIAVFYTNTDLGMTSRKDGWPAQDESVAQTNSMVKSGTNPNVYLAKIELFKKGASSNLLIQTTHFAYDYSLVPGNPSSSDGVGKLTLRKIWTEEYNVKDAYIAPVEFYYETPDLTTTGTTTDVQVNIGRLATQYSKVGDFAYTGTAGDENPAYDPNEIDAWGYVGAKGNPSPVPVFYSALKMLPLSYNPDPSLKIPANFGAPYTLKRVSDPNGAQLLIKYEPSDYSFVQDEPAMQNVPIIGEVQNLPDPTSWNRNVFAVDITAVPTSKRPKYINDLRRKFIEGGEYLQGKFVYQSGFKKCCDGTYDRGLISFKTYLKVIEVTVPAGNPNNEIIEFTVGTSIPPPNTLVNFKDLYAASMKLPFSQALLRYREQQRKHFQAAKSGDILSDAMSIIGMLLSFDGPDGVDESQIIYPPSIPTFISEGSSLRLPSFNSKQNGVPRVKALAMVSPDGSLQNGDAAIIGREFNYTETSVDGMRSSGVATSEPAAMRDQMGIVKVEPARLMNYVDGNSLSSMDIECVELPLGESQLPGASIGYSRVVSTSLFDGETKSGTLVQRFLTVREVPSVRVDQIKVPYKRTRGDDILNILFDVSEEELEIRQGYSVHLQEGHGAPLSSELYVGRTSDNLSTMGVSNDLSLASATYWTYAPLRSEALVIDTINRPLRLSNPGFEMELTNENKIVETNIANFQAQLGIAFRNFITMIPPASIVVPIPGATPSFTMMNRALKSYLTTKVMRHPLRLQATTTVTHGIRDSVEILALDSKTGTPAVTQRFDGYDGIQTMVGGNNHNGGIIRTTVAAHRAYPEMGHKSEAEGLVFCAANDISPNIRDGAMWTASSKITVSGTTLSIEPVRGLAADKDKAARKFVGLFSKGDYISVGPYSGAPKFAYVNSVTGAGSSVDVGLTWESTAPASSEKVVIVRSGRTNQISSVLSTHQLYGVNTQPSIEYARLLRGREKAAETFSDWARIGIISSGMRWWRPLARFYAGTSGVTNSEESYVENKTYPIATTFAPSPCPTTDSPLELVFRKSTPSSPNVTTLGPDVYPRYHSQVVEYWEKYFNGGVCDSRVPAPPGGTGVYTSSIPKWSRWRRFFVNDAGDLIHGIDPDLAVDARTSPDLIFGFREEGYTSGVPSSLDLTSAVKIPMPLLDNFASANFLSADGVSYLRHVRGATTTGRGVYRPYEVFRSNVTLLNDGSISGGDRLVYNAAGTFIKSALWNPFTTPTIPEWKLSGAVRAWNNHGLPTETDDAAGVPTAIRYNDADGGFLPTMVVTGGTVATVWNDNAEDNSLSTTIRKHTGARSNTLDYSRTVSLPALSDSRIEGNKYVVQFWVHDIGENNLNVDIGSTSLTGSSLLAMKVGLSDGFALYEFEVAGPCSTFSISETLHGHTYYVDDVSIRPSQSKAQQFIYDKFGRLTATLDDQGWARIMVYDERGHGNRIVQESVGGKDVLADVSSWSPHRRRTSEEISGGIHATVGASSMLVYDIMNEMFPQSFRKFSIPNVPSGLELRESLLQIDLSPDSQKIKVLPSTPVSKAIEGKLP